MSTQMTPSTPPNDDMSQKLLLACFITLPFTIICLAARWRVRWSKPFLEDWIITFSWVLWIVFVAMMARLVALQGTRHIDYVPSENLQSIYWYSTFSLVFMLLAYCFVTQSIAMLVLRLMGPLTRWRRWLVYVIVAGYWLFKGSLFLFAGICYGPLETLMHPQSAGVGCAVGDVMGRVTIAVALTAGIWHTMTIFALAVLPCTFLWSLQLPLRKKLVLCLLLGCGLFDIYCSSMVTAQILPAFQSSDFTWEKSVLFFWCAIEFPLIFIAGCVPVMKPLVSEAFSRLASKISQVTSRQETTGDGGSDYLTIGERAVATPKPAHIHKSITYTTTTEVNSKPLGSNAV